MFNDINNIVTQIEVTFLLLKHVMLYYMLCDGKVWSMCVSLSCGSCYLHTYTCLYHITNNLFLSQYMYTLLIVIMYYMLPLI